MKPPETRPGARLAMERDPTGGGTIEHPASRPARVSRPRAARRALVVEADPGTRKVLQHALNRCGMIADVVDNGVAAVARARRHRPDAIVMDLQLRDSGGLEVIQWLRSNPALESTPVIVLTTNAHDLSRSKSWSVDAVLLKPVSADGMEIAIRGAIDRRATRR
jgi:two-component system cell cycle response regulator DivK